MIAAPPRRAIRKWQVDVALISIALIWGATFVLVKEALNDVSTLLFLTLRFTLATAALLLLFWNKARAEEAAQRNLRMSLRAGLLAGTLLFAGFVLQTVGLKYTTAAKAGFLTGLYIPLVPILGALVYKKLPQTVELLGVGLAFAGMAVMTVEADLRSMNKGDLLVMCCAVAYAFHILVLGHFATRVNVPVLSIAQIAVTAGLSASSFWWAEPVRIHLTYQVFAAVLITGLLATALALSVQAWAQQYTSPTRTALIFSTEPVFALITSFVLLGEMLNGRGIVGACLILAGILVVELKPRRLTGHPSA